MKHYLSLVFWTLVVVGSALARGTADQAYSNPTMKVRAACSYNDVGDKRYSLFAEENLAKWVDFVEFNRLVDEARTSWASDGGIAIDIRPCTDPLFRDMQFQCYEDDPEDLIIPDDNNIHRLPIDAVVGYNGKYRDPNKDDWRTAGRPLEPAAPPKSYGTQIGEIMFRADSWLKNQMFTELFAIYEQKNSQPLTRFRMNFVPDVDFSRSDNSRVTGTNLVVQHVTLDSMAMKLEVTEDPVLTEYSERFAASDLVSQIPELTDLIVAFHAAFWGYHAYLCVGDVEELDIAPDRTPLTHPVSARNIRVSQGQELFLLLGGVAIFPRFFEYAPEVSTGDRKLIDDVVSQIPSAPGPWKVKLGEDTYLGLTILK